MQRHTIVAAGVFTAVLLASPARAQDCSILYSRGIYDYQSTAYDHSQISSFVNWFRSHEFSTFEQAREGSAKAGIPIGEIIASFGLEASEQKYQEFRREVEAYASGNYARRDQFRQALQRINPGVVNAMNQCLTQGGFHVWIEHGASPEAFRVAARYHATGATTSSTVQLFSVVPTAVQCDNALATGTVVTGSTRRATCQRTPEIAVTITINATENPIGGGALNVPRIPPAAPALPERIDTIPRLDRIFTPPHTAGDAEFDGNGPRISSRVWYETSPDRRRVYLRIAMTAREDGGSTEARGTTPANDSWMVYRAPDGYLVADLLGPISDSHAYVDDDHEEDRFGVLFRFAGASVVNALELRADRTLVVYAWNYTGDIDGTEAGTQTRVRVRTFRLPVRIRPQ